MEIRVTEHLDFITLSLKGRLDIASSASLKDDILRHVANGKSRIILNLAQVDFINSSGLGTLVSILKEVRLAKGRLVLSNLASYVQEIFEITQLSNIFEIFASEADAQDVFLQPSARVV
ncbi:MAG: STAS domain-containing protein [Candidatus Zixiibacteriota bacterium]